MAPDDQLRKQHLVLTAKGDRARTRQGQIDWLIEQRVVFPVDVLGPEVAINAREQDVEFVTTLDMDTYVKVLAQRPDLGYCDFCSSENVRYDYPCRNYRLTGSETEGSTGSWFACAACYSLIQTGKRDALAERCEQCYFDLHEYDADHRPQALEAVKLAQSDFWANREGPPVPLGRPKVKVDL